MSDFVQAPYAAKIPGLFDGVKSGGTINAALTNQMANLLTPEYRSGFATDAKFAGIRSAFAANSVAPWLIKTPTRLYHGGDDVYIPVGLSQKYLADFKTEGVTDANLSLQIIPGYDHPGAVVPVGFSTILWFLSLK